jgi:type VI secretion system protein ImpJ
MAQDQRRVVWYEGMTLDPHHFQQWDRYHRSVVNARLDAVARFNWGVTRLTINEDRLANGEFVIERAIGVMPDGFAFDMPETDPVPAPRNVQEFFTATQEQLDVHLALPAERKGGGNFLLQGAENRRATRFHAQTASVADENTGLDERQIEVGRSQFQVRFGQEPLQEYVTIQIARVRRDASGAFVLDEEFVPTNLSLSAAARIQGLTRRILELLVNKSSSLAERKRSILKQRELSPADVAAIGLLGAVNAYIPVLNHHLNAVQSHPEPLFRDLLGLAGQLAAFVPNAQVAPRDFPTYDHARLSSSYNELGRIILDLLGGASPQANYVRVPLSTIRENLYKASLDEQLLEQAQFYLIARSDTFSEQQLVDKLPQMLRIASPDTIDDVLRTYVRALSIEHTHRFPSGMPVDQQANYFQLQKRGPFWEAIVEHGELAIFVPQEFSSVDMELVAVQAP